MHALQRTHPMLLDTLMCRLVENVTHPGLECIIMLVTRDIDLKRIRPNRILIRLSLLRAQGAKRPVADQGRQPTGCCLSRAQ